MKFTNYSLQRSGPWLTGLLLMFFLGMGSIARAQVPCYTGFAYTTSGSPYQLSFYDSSYDANGDRPVSWQWSFGDGTASTAQNPSHLYNSNGTYVVCLTATFATGCWTTTCDSIYVGQTLACNASYTFTVSPAGVYDFQNTSIGSGGLTYSWDFGDGTTSTVANPSHTFPAPGTYTVCLSIADGAGCSDTYCTAITINGT
nr:PKD domain-containing protein [Bacteroidia bacterium]